MNDDQNVLWDALYNNRDGEKDPAPPRRTHASVPRMPRAARQTQPSDGMDHAAAPSFLSILETVLDHMPEGLLVADASGQILTMNRAALDLHGHASLDGFRVHDEAYADRYEFRDLDGSLLPRKQWPLQRVVRGESFSACEVQVRRPDTGACWYGSYNGTPLYDEAGDALLALLTFRDVTERIRRRRAREAARKRAEAANRAKGDLLASMSHELRTPLTGIIGFASVLTDAIGPQHRAFARIIERSGRRLEEMLEALLTLAKLEAGQTAFECEPLRMAEEVETTFQLFEQEASAKSLRYRFYTPPDARTAHVYVDRGALSIIVQNLISNAIKYTESGDVTVTVALAPPEAVQVTVEDTGIGIDEAFLSRLFVPFARESGRWGSAYEGSGLGLSIAQRFAEHMDGTITVDSEKGAGSRFAVSFPILSAPDEVPDTHAASSPDGGGDFRVLVVEDDATTQQLMRALLAERCDVTLVPTATQALELVGRRAGAAPAFDLVLVDQCLGGSLSGTDLLAQLREMEAFQTTPVVALTAHASPRERRSLLRCGYDACLEQPFTPSEFFSLITQMTD